MKNVFCATALLLGLSVMFISCEKSGTENGTTDNGGSKSFVAVDLGLSVKWASCNLGASKPEEYGDYYAWGETSAKREFTDENYKYYTGVYVDCPDLTGWSTEIYSKYNIYPDSISPDNLTQLEKDDDAAIKKLGGKWRTPTEEEWKELKRNCTWTREFRNGILGVEVKSGKNGNSIFLPASGLKDEGVAGRYMSSSLFISGQTHTYPHMNRNSYCVSRFIDVEGSNAYVSANTTLRHSGYSIRPVQDK